MGCAGSSSNSEKSAPREMKIVMLGNGGVGKSAITFRFVQNKFVESYNPTIEDSYRKQLKVDNHNVVLDILDTAGQEEYTELREVYMRGGEGFVIVYSIVDKKSFQEVTEFRDRIFRVKDRDKVPMVLVGNKCDLEANRAVPKEDGEELAKRLGVPHFESSAQNNINMEEIYLAVCREVIKSTSPATPKK